MQWLVKENRYFLNMKHSNFYKQETMRQGCLYIFLLIATFDFTFRWISNCKNSISIQLKILFSWKWFALGDILQMLTIFQSFFYYFCDDLSQLSPHKNAIHILFLVYTTIIRDSKMSQTRVEYSICYLINALWSVSPILGSSRIHTES